MKPSYRVLFVIFILAAALLSACGAGAVRDTGPKVSADVIVTGTLESINGTQWVVNGKTIAVDPAVIRDRTFQVGDTVKVEGNVQADGTVVVTKVELPISQDLASNSNDSNTNDANINDDSNDNSSSLNINGDDNSNDSSLSNINTNASDDHSKDADPNDRHGGGQGGSGSDDGGSPDKKDDNSNGG